MPQQINYGLSPAIIIVFIYIADWLGRSWRIYKYGFSCFADSKAVPGTSLGLQIPGLPALNRELTFWKFGLCSLEQDNKNMTRIYILLPFGGGSFAESAKEILGKEFIVSCFEILRAFRKCRMWVLKNNSRRSYANCHLQGKSCKQICHLNKHFYLWSTIYLSKHQEALLD